MRPFKRFPLWPAKAPGAIGNEPDQDIPTLTPYWPSPAQATGAAMVICPGGGYWELMDYEGRDYALWLNEMGIAAFVLTYRLAAHGYHYPAQTDDVTRALRYVRARAAEWEIDPDRIGIMGSSAGGHLASYAATHHSEASHPATDSIDLVESRPDLAVLCYAVTSMELWPMDNLLGPEPTAELIAKLSSEFHVTSHTPPCFLWQTQDDPVVGVEHALVFAKALRKASVNFALHIYPTGPHGLGLGRLAASAAESLHPWTNELAQWLSIQKFTFRSAPKSNPTISTLFETPR